MQLHANAELSLKARQKMVEQVLVQHVGLSEAAANAQVSTKTSRKWLRRFEAEGSAGLLDRSSAPATVANRTDERRVEAIAALRRLRFTAPEIAETLDMAISTVSGILTRIGMGKLGRLGSSPLSATSASGPAS